MPEKNGRFVRLWGIRPSQLPLETASTEDLTSFLTTILREAVPFVRRVPSTTTSSSSSSSSSSSGPSTGKGPWQHKGGKAFHNSAAPVNLYERIVSAEELKLIAKEHDLPQANSVKLRPETWSLRRSIHENARKLGTANWDEWTECFKEGHAEAERKFTPTVIGTTLKKEWDCTGVEATIGKRTWENLTLKLEESVHKMPLPLRNRVFPVLQVTASVRGRREFIVVQIAAVPETGEAEESRPDGALRGAYTSVERFKEVEGNVEWIMGTVSDARGVLPGWVQKKAVPGQIAKDVDMFLEWIAKERQKKGDEAR